MDRILRIRDLAGSLCCFLEFMAHFASKLQNYRIREGSVCAGAKRLTGSQNLFRCLYHEPTKRIAISQDRMRVHSLRSALVQVSLTFRWNSFDPFPPKISLVIPLTVCHTTLIILLGEFGIGSTNNLLIGIFLYSHQLPA